MSAPTPPPALTDEQIERVSAAFDRALEGKSIALRDAGQWSRGVRLPDLIAAVIARAKREERERIGTAIEATHVNLSHRINCPDCMTARGCSRIARQEADRA